MNAEQTIFAVMFVQGLVVFCGWLSRQPSASPVHRLRQLPRRSVGELVANQPARLQGKAEREGDWPLFRAPLSGRPCLAYCVRVSRFVGKGGWQTIINDFAMQSFWVRDPTGRILVVLDHEEPRLTMFPVRITSEQTFNGVKEYLWKQAGFLASRDLLPPAGAREHSDGDRREDELRELLPELRIEEGVLLESGRVAVAGCPIADTTGSGASESSYRGQRDALVFEGLDGSDVVVTNLPAVMR